MLPINRNPSPRELRSFRFIWLPLFVAAAAGVAFWRVDSVLVAAIVVGVGLLLVLGALGSAETARTIFVGMQTLTYPIAVVVSTAALGLLFFAVLWPIGWALRALGHDPLQSRREAGRSRWIRYEQQDDPVRALKQY